MKLTTLPILALLCTSLLALSAHADKEKKGGGAWDFEGKAQAESIKLKFLEEALVAHTNNGKECHANALKAAVSTVLEGSEGLSAAKIDAHFQNITMTIQARVCLNRAINEAAKEQKN